MYRSRIIRNNEDNNETSIALMFKQVVIVEVFFAVIFQLAKNALRKKMGGWICFLGGNNSSGTKKYQGSNSSDGGNTGDGVKIVEGYASPHSSSAWGRMSGEDMELFDTNPLSKVEGDGEVRVMTRGFGDLVAKLGDKVVMEVLVRCWSDGDVVVRSW
ncbi:hypothetical protein Tco_0421816 [Tanacetum coccineum]